MPLSFDNALGIHDAALQVRSKRMELLASNIANADTPNYKARDLDFRQVLKQQHQPDQLSMRRTHASHLDAAGGGGGLGEPLYRVPTQPSLDGNTVDPQLEQSAFAENAVQYQASLDFLGDKFTGLRNAFKGGQ
ncbi:MULTISPECIES: flagellar basal body rod protein FlgB [Ectothiorhodospira]|jgi:flagellar basal-body rod protein FlgB|uniref:Flagellar basal body rod protein FlgB n=1 Tax=Ectothiorhodospira marina TaxID=1396821 RepID=A0A1H7FLH8_9GAMM|nr:MULTISPECIES: flagellar basal body rod protein FlgB [Ectothiorhodospira]MCG5516038.1 flagellar basal body rod protein FlgB [Ectothiorhodospira sp. 9100]MCG5519054.1 flagellar basal body rod protein FlgB [Ectothiorhodospira sp. 9905]SEK24980.1 flagellar basal-body rod protein FlgB [Ectothiorhodospira marina]